MANITIIGGGVSGLSAGIYAQLNGHRAVVCERHTQAGGNLTGWQRGEYHIDNCIHWLTGTNPASKTYAMWQELGALGEDVAILQGESLYTSAYKGQRLTLWRELARVEREMLAVSPRDAHEIRSLIRAVGVMQSVCGIGGAHHDRGLSASVGIRAVPALLKYYRLNTGELAARFTHPLLRKFIAAFWGDAFGALALLMVFATFCGDNGGIPAGGSSAMAERMAARFRSLGGALCLGKEAVRIEHSNGRATAVCFADGTEMKADYVILTADPSVAFPKLLSMPLPKQLKRMYADPHMVRFSSYHCAFSCELSALPFEGDYIFDAPVRCHSVLGSRQVILRSFAHEKTFAPEGKTLLQTLTFCTEAEARAMIRLRETDRGAYMQKKQELAAVLERLIVGEFPALEGHLQCIDVWTPATYRRYVDSEIGSYMSFVLPSHRLPKRVSNRIDGLSNVILATQWQQAPGGLPIAAEGGRLAAETVCKSERAAQKQARSQKHSFVEKRAQL